MNEGLRHSWGREAYNTWFTMKERSGIERFWLEIWKQKGTKGDREGLMLPLRGGGERISPLVEMSRNTRGGKRRS